MADIGQKGAFGAVDFNPRPLWPLSSPPRPSSRSSLALTRTAVPLPISNIEKPKTNKYFMARESAHRPERSWLHKRDQFPMPGKIVGFALVRLAVKHCRDRQVGNDDCLVGQQSGFNGKLPRPSFLYFHPGLRIKSPIGRFLPPLEHKGPVLIRTSTGQPVAIAVKEHGPAGAV